MSVIPESPMSGHVLGTTDADNEKSFPALAQCLPDVFFASSGYKPAPGSSRPFD